jgi:hypothetical protein
MKLTQHLTFIQTSAEIIEVNKSTLRNFTINIGLNHYQIINYLIDNKKSGSYLYHKSGN